MTRRIQSMKNTYPHTLKPKTPIERFRLLMLSINDDEEAWGGDNADYMGIRDRFINVLDTISDRERLVLELRFGFQDGSENGKTFADMGKIFGVTKERIRQIQSKALRKLRHPSRYRNYRPEIST